MSSVSTRVGALSTIEVPAVVGLHMAAFPGFYLTSLGSRFLRRYYEHVIAHRDGICLAAFDDGRVVGVVAGFVDPAAFYSDLRRDRIRLALAALPALLASPARAVRFVVNYRRAGEAARVRPSQRSAELASLGVDPKWSGRGIGALLVAEFVSAASRKGASRVGLTTDADGNEAVNRFYQKLGFRLDRTFEAQPGRRLNEYSIEARPERLGNAS